MAQPATNPKIEELRFRLKADPKSRLFFPLAEELRKIDQLGEAEQVLRAGLTNHPGYLSAWVSLGRILREENKNPDAVEALNKALQIDPGNVVAARLLAEAYSALGEKLESLKKYKLVRALLPPDTELDGVIEKLEEELNPVTLFNPPGEDTLRGLAPGTPELLDESPFHSEESHVETEAAASVTREQQVEQATGDAEPMSSAHSESPFEETAPAATAEAISVEQPEGIHIEPAPMAAEMATPWGEEQPVAEQEAVSGEEAASEVFAPAEPAARLAMADDVAETVTMADLYVQQGFGDKAREIYLRILERNPENRDVRLKLDALAGGTVRNPKVVKLERWLDKVKKRGEGSGV